MIESRKPKLKKLFYLSIAALITVSLFLFTLSLTKINHDIEGEWFLKNYFLGFKNGVIFDENRIIGSYEERPDGSWEIIPNSSSRAIEGFAVVKNNTCEVFLIRLKKSFTLKRIKRESFFEKVFKLKNSI